MNVHKDLKYKLEKNLLQMMKMIKIKKMIMIEMILFKKIIIMIIKIKIIKKKILKRILNLEKIMISTWNEKFFLIYKK